MTPLTIEIPGPPVPKQRPRAVRRKDGSGNLYMFTPKKTADYERVVQNLAIQAMRKWTSANRRKWPAEKRFSVNVFFFMPDHRTRDLDNCVKSVTDALNKTVFDDDRQIDEVYAVRDIDKKNPRTVVVVRPL
jgi:Holliday junction resolvase RusA-like endonuclease